MSYIIHSKSQSLGQNPKVVTMGGRTRVSLVDSFPNTYTILSGQTSPDGFWRTEYANGSGAGVQLASGYTNAMWSHPQASTSGTGLETNNNLVLSTVQFTDFDLTVDTRTLSQTRTNFPAFNWERATFVWRYSDSNHYYFYTLKNIGSEFGKRDTNTSGDNPIIIDTGAGPFGNDFTTTTQFQNIRIVSEGKRHQIIIDGSGIIDYMDDGVSGATSAMANGKVGMLSADSYGQWKMFQLYGL